jgi:RNA 3'-phosphate cyclase
MNAIEIDGSYGEGGGQIVRTACSLAAVAQKPCRIFNIRQARRQPGLRPQHLASVRALAQLCGARLEGDRVDSGELLFLPERIAAHDLNVKVETAGSITLMLQALLPAVVASRTPMTIEFEGGGTDTARSPTLDYFRQVFLWFLRKMGVEVELDLVRRGYYPRGGAAMRVQVAGRKPSRVELLERGPLKQVTLFSQAAKVLKARRVAERQIEGAFGVLDALGAPVRSNVDYDPSFSAGSSLCIVAEFANTVIGSDSLGARGKLAEEVGKEAAAGFVAQFQGSACLDRHMADQILPYLALAGDRSSASVSEVTTHCRTNMWVIEKFLDGRFEVRDNTILWKSR